MSYSSAHETSHLRTYAFKKERQELEAGLRSSDAFVLGAARSFSPAPVANARPA